MSEKELKKCNGCNCINLFTNEIVYPHSAHWFKRKMDAQYILDTKNHSTLSISELIEWSFGGKQ